MPLWSRFLILILILVTFVLTYSLKISWVTGWFHWTLYIFMEFSGWFDSVAPGLLSLERCARAWPGNMVRCLWPIRYDQIQLSRLNADLSCTASRRQFEPYFRHGSIVERACRVEPVEFRIEKTRHDLSSWSRLNWIGALPITRWKRQREQEHWRIDNNVCSRYEGHEVFCT